MDGETVAKEVDTFCGRRAIRCSRSDFGDRDCRSRSN